MKLISLDLKMFLLKKAINRLTPRIMVLSKGVTPKTPHSKLILKIWDRLEEVVRKEAKTGCWSDRNFINLLEATKRALIFLCERDKYYKRWLGLLMLYVVEEVQNQYSCFAYEEALNMTVRPLGLTEKEYHEHKEALFEFNLAGYLSALANCPESNISQIGEAREKGAYVDFPTKDKKAIVRMFFPDKHRGEFNLFLTERYEKHG